MANTESKPKSDGGLPKHVVHQISEHTVGGFIIFYFNQETGEPEQKMSFDSPAHSLGLQKHITDWQEAVHQVNLDTNCAALHEGIEALEASQNTNESDSEEDSDVLDWNEDDDDDD